MVSPQENTASSNQREEALNRFLLTRNKNICPRLHLYLLFAFGLTIMLLLLPGSRSSLASPSAEPRWPKGRTIIAVIPRDMPPTYYKDQTSGEARGFAVDALNAIAARAGLQVEYIFEDGWSHILEKLENREADVIPDLGMSGERGEKAAFSDTLEAVSVSFFVRASAGLLSWSPEGQSVGVIEQSLAYERLKGIPNIRLVSYHEFKTGFFDLLSGKIDAFAGPVPTFTRLARESGLEDRIMTVGKPIAEIKRAIAVRRDDRALQDRLNRAMVGFVGGSEYRMIYQKWHAEPRPFWTVRRTLTFGIPLVAMLTIVGGMYRWRYRSLVKLNAELHTALDTIRTLHGILPICSACKKIRDDKGSWRQLEAYISEHTDAQFTHGICTECAKKLYPRYFEKKHGAAKD